MLLDVRPLQGVDARRGIGTYTRGLLGALCAAGEGRRLALLVDAGLPPPELPEPGLQVYGVRRRYHGRLAGYEDAVSLPADLARIRPALYHATTLSLPAGAPCPVVATLHDLIPWALRSSRMWGERFRFTVGRRQLKGARLVLAVSEATARDAVRLAGVKPERIRVIPEAAEPDFRPAEGAGDRVRERWGLDRPYLLYVGALDARKDPKGLLRAWRAAQAAGAEVPLVLAGEAGAQAPGSMEGAVPLGYLERPELVDVLSAAGCLVFPSRYEGFGLPVLEAMACGCPVAAYANSSLIEVGQGAAKLVRDGDAEALGRVAAELILDRRLAAEARARGLERAAAYSWERVAREVAAAYSEALA